MRKTSNNFFGSISAHYTFVTVFVILIGCLAVSGQSKLLIHVSPESVIDGKGIDLGEVSRIMGEPAEVERLRSISLGYAPNIGMMREIGRGQILLAINAAGFTENEFTLDSPAKIVIRRSGQIISSGQMSEAIEKLVLSQFAADHISARIVRLDLPEMVQVPTGKLDIRANMSGVRDVFEKFPIPVEIRVDNKIVRTFSATLEIEAFAEVLVASRDLNPNKKIKETDVRLEKCRIEKPITNYLKQTESLHGMELVRGIETGHAITIDSLVAGVVIKFGDPVRIEALSGNLKIIITGEARAAGKIGDRIAVRNTQSGVILQAVILDEGLVKVTF